MRSLALLAISAYQRFVSPYKGFCCAYRAHTGHRSCSALGYRAIRMHGVLAGIGVLRRRFERCSEAHRRFGSRPLRLHGQRGVCDLSCDLPCDLPCDSPDLPCPGAACDALYCCDCVDCSPCDFYDKQRRRRKDEDKYVYIPPHKWPAKWPSDNTQGRDKNDGR